MFELALGYVTQLLALPRPVWALVGGTLLSFAFTQRAKFAIPSTWSPHSREVGAQAAAFVSGFASTYFIWGTADASALIAALVVGLWSPALWSLSMLVIGWKWPEVKKLLSQNKASAE